MTMKTYCSSILKKHPLGALYAVLLGIVAFSAALPMFISGMWDAAVVDLAMAGGLIFIMLKSFFVAQAVPVALPEKSMAWTMVIFANILALLPTHDFPGSLSTAFAFTLLMGAFILYFSGRKMAVMGVVPTLWCCVFMPYHEEFMLLFSYPLRLSAAALSAGILKVSGIEIVSSGTSLELPGLDIAITDACSGINQLDAFILIAFAAVQILHKKVIWKSLHFAFIIPAMITGNSLRIVLTVWLYKGMGEIVLQNTWHTVLGYVQILFALLIFLVVGRIFIFADTKVPEDSPC